MSYLTQQESEYIKNSFGDNEQMMQIFSDSRKIFEKNWNLSKGQNLGERYRSLYSAFDECVEMVSSVYKSHGGNIPCTSGCSHCCRSHFVGLFEIEAEIIAQEMKNKNIFNEFIKSASIAGPTKNMRDREASDFGEDCIFLKNEKCSIYSIRPFECRAYFSMNKNDCQKYEKKEITEFNIIGVYSIVFTAMQVVTKISKKQKYNEMNAMFKTIFKKDIGEIVNKSIPINLVENNT